MRALLLFWFLLVGGVCFGQCPTGDLEFNTQDEIDNFLIDYPNCTEIEGNVTIASFFDFDISNLSAFQNIRSINGSLTVENLFGLTSLSGLDSLISVGGSLRLESNLELPNLMGLERLTTIGDDLGIESHSGLMSLSGLDNLNSIGGSLLISSNSQITDLSGLISLSFIGGSLTIRTNNDLISLSGLNNINNIPGDLIIDAHWDELTSLSGLDNVTNIGGSLQITSNRGLTNLSGLDGLTSIGTFLKVFSNDNLVSLSGLENLTSLLSSLTIEDNDNLLNLTGLEGLNAIGGTIVIDGNLNMTNLLGLDNVTSVGGFLLVTRNENLNSLMSLGGITSLTALDINYNNSLTDLSGLDNVTDIGSFFKINNNDNLVSLTGLRNVTTINSNLRIFNNPALEICSVVSICNHLFNSGASEIANNAPGCNTVDEVLSNCDFLGQISHPIFYDLNENGSLDEGEPFYQNTNVNINPGSFISYGNMVNGGISYQEYGNYSISYNPLSTPNWELTTPNSYNVTLTEANPSDTVYFGLKPINIFSNLQASIATNNFRCNESQTLNIYAENMGTTFNDGTLWIEIDENVLATDFLDTPDTIVAPNLYGWHFTDLFPSGFFQKQISVTIPGPPDFPIGDALTFESYVTYTDANGNQTSDTFTYTEIVDCAYDPNDKLVSPIYPFNYALVAEPLTYTIRFQNTGNAEAYDVVIRDTLDPNLDPTTFRVITSSHDEVLSTELKDNQYLSFNFTDIFLPDSTTNFEGSQGFVMYSIQAYDDIAEGTEITNTAGIYFDFNPPIITNTTENKMVYSFDVDEDGFDIFEDCDDENELAFPGAIEIPNNGIDEDCDGEDLLSSVNDLGDLKVAIFPNPTDGKLTVRFGEAMEGELTVRDYTGKEVLTQQVQQESQLDINNLPDGIYVIEIKTASQTWIERVVKM